VLRQHPHRAPKTPKKGPSPLIIAVCKQTREMFTEAYRRVVAAYLAASALLRAGNRLVTFPEGTFPPALAFVGGAPRARAG
jgi:hypothetical protein